MFTVGSLFTGVGGFDLGFSKSEFKISWANEVDLNACKTYKKNFDSKIYECCINKLDIEELSYVDVITAGFPCQPFSIAGYQKGFDDERGGVFFSMMNIIQKKNPKAVVLENVRNLICHNNGKTLKRIINELDNIGYNISYSVLNSINYGIPQNRERVFFVCFQKELNLFYDFSCLSNHRFQKLSLNEIFEENVNKKYYYNNTKYYNILKSKMVNKDNFYQWRRKYVRENKSGVCPTLTANMGTGGHNVPLVFLEDIRKLTPKECFLLQGFNRDFLLPEDMADSHLYKQAGNSVCVRIIEDIAFRIMKYFNSDESEKDLLYTKHKARLKNQLHLSF